jgi:tetratricopeptide (TPR) repeat protein
MKKWAVLILCLVLVSAAVAPGWAAGQVAAADKDLLEFLPRSTVIVMVLDFQRLLGIDAIAKALAGPGFEKLYGEFVQTSGIDPKRDVAYISWGIPAAALSAKLSMPASPAPLKDMAMIVGLSSDSNRMMDLVKDKVPAAKQEVYNGVTVFNFVDEDVLAAAAPAGPGGMGPMPLRLAFLDGAHIVFGDDSGIRGVIDVFQKKAESLAQDPEMAAMMGRVDKSGIAWIAVSYPPEQVKMIADANPLLRAIEGFKGMIVAVDDKDSTLVVDIRTLGGTAEQNAVFAANLDGLKAVGALYAAEQPALAELLSGIALTSGEDYTRLTLTVSHETLGKLYRFVEATAGGPKAAEPGAPEWRTLSAQADDLYREGQTDRALEAYGQALKLAEEALGPDHPDVASVLNGFGYLYYRQKRYAEAEPLYKRALEIRDKAFGPDTLDLAWSLFNLGDVYRDQDRYAEAEPLFKRALDIRERALGPDHPDVANVLNRLGNLCYDQDRYAEAEPFYKRSIAIFEKVNGPDHLEVAVDLHNLGGVYLELRRYTEAEPLLLRALAIREKALGPDHADLANTLNRLGNLNYRQNRYAEAEPLYKRAGAIWEKVNGPDDLDVAVSYYNLGNAYSGRKRYAEAEPAYKRALEIREKAFGPDSIRLVGTLNMLGRIYYAQDMYAQAKPLDTRVLAIREKALGPDHPDVARSLNNLALLCSRQGLYTEAEPLLLRALAIREKALGPDHPDVAESLENLAKLYRAAGRLKEAEEFESRAARIRSLAC